MVLTDVEKSLIEELFKKFDKDNRGFIDKANAKGSTKMTSLIDGMRVHATGKTEGKIYLEDLMKFYKEFKEKKIKRGRNPDEDICASFIEGMIARQENFAERVSFCD